MIAYADPCERCGVVVNDHLYAMPGCECWLCAVCTEAVRDFGEPCACELEDLPESDEEEEPDEDDERDG